MNTLELTDAQIAGQRLMAGFSGTEFNAELRQLIREFKVGGVILFSRNIENPSQLRHLCRSIQDYAKSCGQPPLFIAVDQEGGLVARLKAPFTEFPGQPYIRTSKDAIRFGDITGRELFEVGINMDMAPVLDVAPEGAESVMAGRIFGHDPVHAGQMGSLVIGRLQKKGVLAVGKHFPGIGRTTLDSHQDLPTLDCPLEALEAFDLLPFKKAIEAQAAGIMLSHIRYTAIDPQWPASLSPRVTTLLRDKLGYKGLVLTDDLDMGAIANYYDIQTAVGQLLRAGVDMALICHPGPAIETAFSEITAQMAADAGLSARSRESAERVMKLKREWRHG